MREIRDIHEPFIVWLKERDVPYIYHRADRKSGIQTGHPDFTVLWCGRVALIECKTEKGKLSEDQKTRIAFLQRNGCPVTIARSVEECCEAVRNILCEKGRALDASASFPDAIREEFRKTKEAVAAVEPRNSAPVGGKGLFLGKIGVIDYVFEGSGMSGTGAKMLRVATPTDLLELRA